MKADWTNGSEVIGQWLDELGRAGIPVYAIYLPNGEVDLLPQAITTEMLINRLEAASEQFPASDFAPIEAAETCAHCGCDNEGEAASEGSGE